MANTKSSIVKIFWPSDLLDTTESALILGWQNSPTDLFVIDLVSNIYRDGLEQPLDIASLVTKFPISKVTQFCGHQPLSILGQLSLHKEQKQDQDYILQCHIDPESIYPCFHAGNKDIAVQLIIFDRPDPHRMQYFSLQPVPFERFAHRQDGSDKQISTFNIFDTCEATHDRSLTQLHINQMNCAQEVAVVLQRNLPKLGSRKYRNRSQSFHEQVTISAFEVSRHLWAYVVDFFQRISQEIRPWRQYIARRAIDSEVAAIDTISWALCTPVLGTLALTDFSVTARELDFRIQKLKSWPTEYLTLRERKRDWASITSYHPDYIKFYNGMWLIANDLIFGLYLVSICLNNEDVLAEGIYQFIDEYSIDTVAKMMWWLKGYPAGLKLNSELAGFFSDLFLWLIASWRDLLEAVHPYLPLVVRAIGIGGFLGASLSISLMSDVLSLLTLHLYIFYTTSARIYEWQLTILISLFHLFRGKKRNVLRARIDSCDYDLDQLLLGTILFTLLAFLFPTVIVFYLTFAAARIALKFGKTGMDMVLAFLVQFPLFALLLRIKDAKRLPGGIRLNLLPPASSNHGQTAPKSGAEEGCARVSLIYIESKPLSFDLMFQSLVNRQSKIMGDTLRLSVLLKDVLNGSL
ncbi:Putative uncharacterized protein [Taphrina deformans PYCC 5710]|uniref:N-acetylglucosaminyl transferase component Gpi1 n=1 Tax=Taphrina deformans (strain PYCC 5710 / ATCC 11124 / CBS 356.35 / IMI 108563 / JCM 9778 / NBRC 8474) TaxID=1097556 RepID=R4XDR7_TAPDE|nr:Putative uncharacterized protein [Taphrina deformans PYCC 5710]|eukprot:CCG82565.1 Putative uncharacterized protein [Taphrina deformans PYCC 5710]